MTTISKRRAAGAAALTVLVSAAALVLTSGSAGAVNVATEAQFRAAFANAAETNITLTADITLTCPGGDPARISATNLVINGNRHTLRQTCPDSTILINAGTGSLTVTDLTMTGGDTGIVDTAPLTVTRSTISGLSGTTSATGIVVIGDLAITDSVISDIAGPGVAGIVAVSGMTATGLDMSGLVGSGSATGAVVVGDPIELTDTTIIGTTGTGGSASGLVAVPSGGLLLDGTTVQGTTGQTNASGVVAVPGGDFRMVDSAVLDTSGASGNGLITVPGGVMEMLRSTVADNVGPGMITVPADGTSVVNSTVSGNDLGVVIVSGGPVDIVYSDIVENGGQQINGAVETAMPVIPPTAEAPLEEAGIDLAEVLSSASSRAASAVAEATPQQESAQLTVGAETVNFFGTVVALPQDGAVNCDLLDGETTSAYDFSDDDTCELTGTGDRENAGDPELGALADNGGPTPTLLPADTSPLVNFIPLESCQDDGASGIETDQRLLPRPAETGCEIGSVEIQPPPEPEPAPGPVAAAPPFTG